MMLLGPVILLHRNSGGVSLTRSGSIKSISNPLVIGLSAPLLARAMAIIDPYQAYVYLLLSRSIGGSRCGNYPRLPLGLNYINLPLNPQNPLNQSWKLGLLDFPASVQFFSSESIISRLIVEEETMVSGYPFFQG